MGLKEVLIQNDIPLPPDFDERMDLVIAALRRSPDYPEKLQKMKGGGPTDSEDWLGPQLTWFINTITTPAARTAWKGLFAVIFFVSYLEKIPIFGNVLSAVLDLMIMGSKILTKSFQKAIPPLFGLIPLPYTSMFGLMMAALFGYIVWPVLATVSLSRQDFTAAIDSFVRIIPPPLGDAIADTFLEGNRTVARLNQKRIALSNDISKGVSAIGDAIGNLSGNAAKLGEKTREAASGLNLKERASQGLSSVKAKIPGDLKERATQGLSSVKEKAAAQLAGKRLSRRTRSTYKWHRRTRRRSVRR